MGFTQAVISRDVTQWAAALSLNPSPLFLNRSSSEERGLDLPPAPPPSPPIIRGDHHLGSSRACPPPPPPPITRGDHHLGPGGETQVRHHGLALGAITVLDGLA